MFDISFSDELHALRERLEGCRLVAYADLSTRMVLQVSAEPKPRREEIDALCDLAAQCLDAPSLRAFFEDEAPYTALLTAGDEVQFFVRSLSDPADALILIIKEPVEQSVVWKAAQDLLDPERTDGAAE
ncbi:MAG: hypothetical protein AAFV87_17935 [Pseudomonadota bacterium]